MNLISNFFGSNDVRLLYFLFGSNISSQREFSGNPLISLHFGLYLAVYELDHVDWPLWAPKTCIAPWQVLCPVYKSPVLNQVFTKRGMYPGAVFCSLQWLKVRLASWCTAPNSLQASSFVQGWKNEMWSSEQASAVQHTACSSQTVLAVFKWHGNCCRGNCCHDDQCPDSLF